MSKCELNMSLDRITLMSLFILNEPQLIFLEFPRKTRPAWEKNEATLPESLLLLPWFIFIRCSHSHA